MDLQEVIDHYTQFHPWWFESPGQYRPSDEYLRVYYSTMPVHWELQRRGIWYSAGPPNLDVPDQGWKIHVSISTKDTVAALWAALPVLRDECTRFKFLVDTRIAGAGNSKLWPRQACGKFITVYPISIKQFYRLGNRLSEALTDFSGPFILSDRQWPASTCVYYRYGGFKPKSTVRVDGAHELQIMTPTGLSVVDERTPYWNPPTWASDPFAKQPESSQLPGHLAEGRYAVRSALAFSSKGGVYRAFDRSTMQDVVLKEARPRVEVGKSRCDAIAILKKEHRILRELSESNFFVKPIDLFQEWEHCFLVEEFLNGVRFGNYTIRQNPIYRTRPDSGAVRSYLTELVQLWSKIRNAIEYAHNREIIIGDISFNNIIVSGRSNITILDLETAVKRGLDPVVGLHTPGLCTPKAMETGEIDVYDDYFALGMLMFGSIFLCHVFVGFQPKARARFLHELTIDLGLPEECGALIADLLAASLAGNSCCSPVARRMEVLGRLSQGNWVRTPRLERAASDGLDPRSLANLRREVAETISGIGDYVLWAGDPNRRDRLFPADPHVFETNPLSIAYGAAGVLYVLHHLGRDVPPKMKNWFLDRVEGGAVLPPGLYCGTAGVAWVLNTLGATERAIDLIEREVANPLLARSPNIIHGSAGYGLALLKLWRASGKPELLEKAAQIGERILDLCERDGRGARWRESDGTVRLGYAYGGSGIALFLLYLFLETKDHRYYSCGLDAISFELLYSKSENGRHIGFPNVALEETDNATVYSHYWESGTAGFCTSIVRYCYVAKDAYLEERRRYIEKDTFRKYAVFPPLFRGIAGLGNYLLDAFEFTNDEQYLAEAWLCAEGVLLFKIEREQGIAFPGEQALRESTDLATGSSGIALFLHRLLRAREANFSNLNFLVDEILLDHGNWYSERGLGIEVDPGKA